MKFRKNLLQVVGVSDPLWGPFWIDYKYLKKKILAIDMEQGSKRPHPDSTHQTDPKELTKSACEVDFFRLIQNEVKKTNDFFNSEEHLYKMRRNRIVEGFALIKEYRNRYDDIMSNRLLHACLQFFKDVLFLENFAIMNYCGFSKILKKHDKHTG